MKFGPARAGGPNRWRRRTAEAILGRMQDAAGEMLWRRRAERLAEQLEILRMAHVSLVRRDREMRAEAEAEAARLAVASPRYVVRCDGRVLYRGTSRNAALIAARNAQWAGPRSSVVVLDGEAVIWSSRAN